MRPFKKLTKSKPGMQQENISAGLLCQDAFHITVQSGRCYAQAHYLAACFLETIIGHAAETVGAAGHR